jgi:hypothetical protein
LKRGFRHAVLRIGTAQGQENPRAINFYKKMGFIFLPRSEKMVNFDLTTSLRAIEPKAQSKFHQPNQLIGD